MLNPCHSHTILGVNVLAEENNFSGQMFSHILFSLD